MSTEIHALAGAYALDAVSDLERMEFSRHLAGCEACGLEIGELRATAARLADAAWVTAPPRLRENVLRQAACTRQARPGRAGDLAGPAQTVRTRWRRWMVGGIAASVLAGAAALGTFAVQEQRGRPQRQAAQRTLDQMTRIESVMAAADAGERHAQVDGGGRLAVVYSRENNAAVVMCADLAQPAHGRAYQVWLMHHGQATRAGLLPAGQRSGTVLVTALDGADGIAISQERAGGAGWPRTRLATVPLS